ncbi:MAG: pantoate--beta-alanine ligase [Bacteroidaceae bacterium]|nr:pantoate--beta-alanine ligase [Bacteroidaceae bacterium]
MITVETVGKLQAVLSEARQGGRTVGLVPTMGALHAGHASLVTRCVAENDICVVSVFVNPTQFNDKNDLASYPRDLEADCTLLRSIGAHVVFAPTVEEVYPEPDTRQFSYPPVDTVMEGARRPGHFNGVCQVVSKLFQYVQPERAYFGEKDFQQIAVVRAMTRDLRLGVDIVACPIVREESGLALSSRNQLLTASERATAATISRTLSESIGWKKSGAKVAEVEARVVETIDTTAGLRTEYYQIVDSDTLQPVADWESAKGIVGCITVYCGSRPVRLIDNIRYK